MDLHEEKKPLVACLPLPNCLPGTLGLARCWLLGVCGAQVVPTHKVKNKPLTAASCPGWILPSQATFFRWPLRALAVRRALETGTAALWPDFTRRLLPCGVSDEARAGGGADGCSWFWFMLSKGLMGSM